MLRSIRFASCAAVALVAVSVLASGPASAAALPTQSGAGASAFAAHGLGARRPTAHIAPRAAQFSALDVLPASVDLKQWAVTPGDQGALSSCVTWAIDYGMLGWYSKYTGRAGQPFAPMYTYSQINNGVDAGSYPTAALEVAKTQGNDTRAHYTQGDYDWHTKPTAAEKANAANFKIKGYTTLFAGSGQAGASNLVKQAIATKHPVAIEMAVRHGFDVLGANANAVDDDITSQIRGYHEVLAVGYDAAGLIIENSWGTGWANGGFGRLSWRVVQHDVYEADTIDGFLAPPPPPPPTPPVVTKPTVKVRAGVGAGAAIVHYNVTWTAKTGTSGAVTTYHAWLQVDHKAFRRVKLTKLTATSFTVTARRGHTYRVAVRADAHNASSTTVYGANFGPAPAQKK